MSLLNEVRKEEMDRQDDTEGYCSICSHKLYNHGTICRRCSSVERVYSSVYIDYTGFNKYDDEIR